MSDDRLEAVREALDPAALAAAEEACLAFHEAEESKVSPEMWAMLRQLARAEAVAIVAAYLLALAPRTMQ